jgi:hypothetical protein
VAKPGSADLDIYQGDDFDFTFRIRNADGSYKDLTGYTGAAQIRSTESSTTILATFTVTVPTQTGSALGSCTLSLGATTTATLTPTADVEPVWDVQLSGGSPVKKKTWLKGNVTVWPEVTRP